MWPFRKKIEPPRARKMVRRVVVGFIIGGAISSIVGKSLLKERRKQHLGKDEEEDE